MRARATPEAIGHGLRNRIPRELDAVRLNDVPDERRHRNAPMLDLCMAQEPHGGLVALTPEVELGQVQRVVVPARPARHV